MVGAMRVMHELLKNYVIEGLSYMDSDELVKNLKQANNSYYIDDLNFLTMPSNLDCLCGYFPGTDFARNFSYVRLINKSWQTNPTNIDIDFRSLDGVFISCRDLNVLEQYLDFFYENRLFKEFSLNVPARFGDAEQTAEKVVPNLIDKYNGYYNISSHMFDYRFQDLNTISSNEEDSSYVIESSLQDLLSDWIPVYDDWYVFKKYGIPIFAYGCSLQYRPERIGIKCVPFANNFHAYEDKVIVTEDALYLWKYLAKKFTNDGYVVKGIAINDGFDNDDMYQRMGMEKYRCFIKLKTDNTNGR